ncbi:MAG: hypothetical protein EOP04_13285 [Proteobacteria bacterium]|nr:MAG: hypothetical protein EOP04_13285 [Pseudomonadota bacterium]
MATIWNTVCGRFFFDLLGMSHFTVFLRWLWCVASQLIIFDRALALLGLEAKDSNSNTVAVTAIVFASFTLLNNMRDEYKSKYTDLLKLHDEIKTFGIECRNSQKGKLLLFMPNNVLRFVDRAIKWQLEDDRCFKQSFRKIIVKLDHLKRYYPDHYDLTANEYPTIDRFLKARNRWNYYESFDKDLLAEKQLEQWEESSERRKPENKFLRDTIDQILNLRSDIEKDLAHYSIALSEDSRSTIVALESIKREISSSSSSEEAA